jgi:quercetin dioxygenase-like cupin family protein
MTNGSFDSLAVTQPYPGLARRTFDSEHASVNEYRFAPRASFPLHVHPEEQLTFVLEGEIELTAGADATRLQAGDWAITSGGVEHGVTAGAGGARVLAVVVPRRSSPDAYTVVGD